MFSSLTLAHKKTYKQWELLIGVCHLGWLKRPPISEMRQEGEKERDRITDSLGITAPEDRLKMRPGIMMVDLTTNDLSDMESRAPKKRKANGEKTTLKEMIGQKKITTLEIGYVANTRYDGKYKAKIQQQISLPNPGKGRA